MIIDTKYDISEIVYLKTCKDQDERIITGIQVRLSSHLYELSCGSVSSWHYEFEFSRHRDILKATSN